MTTTTLRRAMIFLIVVGMTLAGTVVPAFALATGSSSLADAEFFSGQTSQLEVTVNNTASPGGLPVLQPGGSSIDAVQLLVDTSVVTPKAVAANAPDNWEGSFNAARGTVYYFADEGAEIPPGGSLTFSLPADFAGQASDTNSSVIVQVSDNGGTTATNAGVLGFAVKILEVIPGSTTIVKPVTTQAANLVTEQQDNADIKVQVKNHANTTKSVTASATKAGGSSSVTTAEQTKPLLPGETQPFTFDAVFGAPGSLSIQGRATTNGGTAVPDVFSGITVQQAISLAFNNDLAPRAAVPGTTQPFTLSVNKAGGPPGTLTTTFSLAGQSDSKPLTVGAPGSIGLNYSIAIPLSAPDGDTPATLTYSGTDANGAVIASTTRDLGNVLLDRLRPVLELVLTPPASSVQGADPAAGAGDTVTVSGTVKRDGVACGACDVVNEQLRFLDADGTQIGDPRPGPNLTVASGGTNPGSVSGSFTVSNVPAGAVDVRLTADAIRAANLKTGAGSGIAEVDIVAPVGVDLESELSSVDGSLTTTGRDADGDFVDVPFSELIGFGQGALSRDWSVEGSVVESLEYINGSAAGTGKVRLRLATELDRNATPTVSYTPVLGPLARAFDRVDLSLVDQTLEALDNIAPDVLGIIEVSTYRGGTANDTDEKRIDQGSFDGVYYTRDRTPVVTVNNVTVGDTVRVFRDDNGDGVQQGGEATLGTLLQAAATTAEVRLNDLGAGEKLINISAYAIDGSGNAGLGSTGDQLNLEFTPPTITGFTRSNNTITVTFSEAVPVGRDAAFDWLVLSEGRWRPVDAVMNGDGNNATRSLTINAAVVPGDVDAVRWESVTTSTDDDYADIARNEANPAGVQYNQ